MTQVRTMGPMSLRARIVYTCIASFALRQSTIDRAYRDRVVSRAGFGPKLDKNFGIYSGLRRAVCLRCTKI